MFKRTLNGDERNYVQPDTGSAADEVYFQNSLWRPLGIDTCDNLVAIAAPPQTTDQLQDGGFRTGRVVIGLRTANDQMKWLVEGSAGYVPDILKFSDDCRFVLVPNIGGRLDYGYTTDESLALAPPSLTMLEVEVNALKEAESFRMEPINSNEDIGPGQLLYDPNNAVFRLKDMRFEGFDNQELQEKGVYLGSTGDAFYDIVPEGTNIVHNRYGFAICQNNNAFVIVDLEEGLITQIARHGYKDISKDNQGMDVINDGEINIQTFGRGAIRANMAPDHSRTYYASDGEMYIIMANEGNEFALQPGNVQTRDLTRYRTAEEQDMIDNGQQPEITDEIPVGDLTKLGARSSEGNRTVATEIQEFIDATGGDTLVSRVNGFDESANEQKAVYLFGGRSFAIVHWTGKVVFDSGDAIEQIEKNEYPYANACENPFASMQMCTCCSLHLPFICYETLQIYLQRGASGG